MTSTKVLNSTDITRGNCARPPSVLPQRPHALAAAQIIDGAMDVVIVEQ